MGVFDYVRCNYPLPEGAPGPDADWQTKDTDAQYLELYEIRADGSLWFEEVKREWVADDSRPIFKGYMKRVSSEWKPEPMTGELRFYTSEPKNRDRWWEFSAYFVNGQLKHLETIHAPDKEPT